MISALYTRQVKASMPALCAIFAVLVLYIVSIVYMFDPETAQMLDDLKAAMPELFEAFGMNNDTSTLTGFALNYLYGFLFTLLPLIFIMMLAHRMYVRSQSSGELAYILATPHSRLKIALTLLAASVSALLLMLLLVTVSEIGVMSALHGDELEIEPILRANIGLGALWLFMLSVMSLSSVSFTRPSMALWTGGGFCLVSFLFSMAGQLGDELELLRKLSFFTLFDGYGLAASTAEAWTGAAILAALACLVFAVFALIFRRRDFVL